MPLNQKEKCHDWNFRVQYSETDQMGVAHHGNYINWFETARIEYLREMGWTYKEFEEAGFILPVLEVSIKYKKAAYYDDLLTMKTWLIELKKLKMEFQYQIWRGGEHLSDGRIVLGCLSKTDFKPARIPDHFTKIVKKCEVGKSFLFPS